MEKEDLINQFVETLDFDKLIALADILDVEHEEKQWLDDEYPDKEDELGLRVAEAMQTAIGAKI